MKRSIAIIIGGALVLLFQNCEQNVNFIKEDAVTLNSDSGVDETLNPPVTPVTPVLPAETPESSQQFKVNFSAESAPLDMIWVIDNSGSMSTEASLVRKNFDSFLMTLGKSTNFRMLLISQQGTTGTSVSFPSSVDLNTHLQINQRVESTDGTTILIDKLKTLPAGFLRVDSKKIIVFVTDDNSRISASTFLSELTTQQKWPSKDVSVFSFIGLDAVSSPCLAAVGTVYKNLAVQTLGHNYNICQEDWSSHFSDLIDVSVSKAVRRFSITAEVVNSIIEVKVGNVMVPPDFYSLSGKILTLADSVVLAENSIVTVRYR